MTSNCQGFNFQADGIVCQSILLPNIPALTARHGHSAANTAAAAGLNRDSKTERQRMRTKKKEKIEKEKYKCCALRLSGQTVAGKREEISRHRTTTLRQSAR